MATQVVTIETMVCDLHQGSEHEAEAGTIEFTYKGTDYKIDLCVPGDERMDRAMAPFIEAAQVVTRSRTRTRQRNRAASNGNGSGKTENDQIREWARKEGWDVSDRGRIANEIIAAYKDAHKRTRTTAAA